MRDIHSLWVGDQLGPVEELCLASFVDKGHKVFLHAYSDLWVPDGVSVLNARDLVPEDRIFRAKNGSLAAFSDYFRLKILRNYDAIWIDTDIFCLKEFAYRHPNVLCIHSTGPDYHGMHYGFAVNMAPFALPRDSELLKTLIDNVENPRRALRYLPPARRLQALLRSRVVGRVDPGSLPWGWASLIPLTQEVVRLGLVDNADHPKSFGLAGGKLFRADFDYRPSLAAGAEFAHFLSSKFWRSNLDLGRPEQGSFFEYCVDLVGHRTRYFQALCRA